MFYTEDVTVLEFSCNFVSKYLVQDFLGEMSWAPLCRKLDWQSQQALLLLKICGFPVCFKTVWVSLNLCPGFTFFVSFMRVWILTILKYKLRETQISSLKSFKLSHQSVS